MIRLLELSQAALKAPPTLFTTYLARRNAPISPLVDAAGTTRYTYDAAGQLLSEGGLWADDTVSYFYNNRLRTGLTLLQPDASSWSQIYGYDGTRRLTSVSSPAGSFSYAYDPAVHQQAQTGRRV